MKRNKNKWHLNYNGDIILLKKRNWFYKILFGTEWNVIETYELKKPYSKRELRKLEDMLYWIGDSEDDIIATINAIRPNTFKESLSEVKTNGYYVNTTEK